MVDASLRTLWEDPSQHRAKGTRWRDTCSRQPQPLEEVAGCYLYLVSRDPDDGHAVWVTEVWESAEAHRASLGLVAVQELIRLARPLIAGMGERFEHRPIGGKGLAASG